MTLTIELTPQEEARLAAAADQAGHDPSVWVRQIVMQNLPPVNEETDLTLALFAQWDREDADMTAEEIAAAQQEYEIFKRSINAEREQAGARTIYP